MPEFVHLHLHSEYSLLDGACRISDIPKAAKANGHKAVAITDHGVMYGVVDFYKACIADGVKPIIGCEVYVAPRSRFDKTRQLDSERYHLVLLVKNEMGYKNLIYMVSKGFTEGFYSKPSVDLELLSQHSDGIIALSACLGGYIPQCILNDNLSEAESYAVKLHDIFGEGNFYLELQNHYIEGQDRVNEVLVGISERTGIPLVATNDVHYINRTDADTQAVLMCIQTNHVISDGRPIGFVTDEFYYKSTEEMELLFSKYNDAISNTAKIADMCNFEFNFKKLYLPAFKPADGKAPKTYLRELAFEGLESRIKLSEIVYSEKHDFNEYKLRIEYELMVISSMGYAEYFLIVWDFVNYAKNHDIPTGPGRGSGAGSLVAFLLRITDVDPVRYNLLFEAFLNPERISMPDFDIDFCYERRDEVIRYVMERYGSDHVSQIITFGTMAARAAIRDVGRALGMSYADVDMVAKLVPQRLGITLGEALEIKELKTLYDSSSEVKKLIDTSVAVEGMPRHASTHAAGVVITDEPVYNYVPLAGSEGSIVTQFDMDTVAQLGLLKFDFLALRYLTIISNTEKQVREYEPDFSIRKAPLDDKDAYELISSGHTDGLFQLESGGMRQMLVNLQPSSIEDIMISIALYRPGPMDSVPKFIENRKNKDKIVYAVPELKDILDETCGCIVYQEQVMQIFRSIAGYTYGKADIVRRAISKKKAGVIEQERTNFIMGALCKGVDEKDAVVLFEDMTAFSNYGFKKSHAAAYGIISFQTAYLKSHYPAMYLSSLFTSVLGNAGKMAQYTAECVRYKIKLLPPDINESSMMFHVFENDIRFGLLAIKNVGKSFIKSIIEERNKGKFTSFVNFVNRMSGAELNKRQVEALICAGSFDNLGVFRSRLLAAYEKIIDSRCEYDKKNLEGQINMFDPESGNDDGSLDNFEYPPIPDFTLREKLTAEKKCSGIYFSGHMLDGYMKHIELSKAVKISDIVSDDVESPQYKDKDVVTVCGIVTSRNDKTTKNGENMAFIKLEDRYAEIEGIVFPKVMEKYNKLLVLDSALLVTGEITMRGDSDDESPKILIRNMEPLKTDDSLTIQKPLSKLKLYLRVSNLSGEDYKKAVNLIQIFEGLTPAVFYDSETHKYIKDTGLKAETSQFVLRELTLILGEGSVVLK